MNTKLFRPSFLTAMPLGLYPHLLTHTRTTHNLISSHNFPINIKITCTQFLAHRRRYLHAKMTHWFNIHFYLKLPSPVLQSLPPITIASSMTDTSTTMLLLLRYHQNLYKFHRENSQVGRGRLRLKVHDFEYFMHEHFPTDSYSAHQHHPFVRSLMCTYSKNFVWRSGIFSHFF